jgi:hypothetical protein
MVKIKRGNILSSTGTAWMTPYTAGAASRLAPWPTLTHIQRVQGIFLLV